MIGWICSAALGKVHDFMLKHNIIQYVEEETFDPHYGDYVPTKLYPKGFDPKNQDHWDELVRKEFPEDAR